MASILEDLLASARGALSGGTGTRTLSKGDTSTPRTTSTTPSVEPAPEPTRSTLLDVLSAPRDTTPRLTSEDISGGDALAALIGQSPSTVETAAPPTTPRLAPDPSAPAPEPTKSPGVGAAGAVQDSLGSSRGATITPENLDAEKRFSLPVLASTKQFGSPELVGTETPNDTKLPAEGTQSTAVEDALMSSGLEGAAKASDPLKEASKEVSEDVQKSAEEQAAIAEQQAAEEAEAAARAEAARAPLTEALGVREGSVAGGILGDTTRGDTFDTPSLSDIFGGVAGTQAEDRFLAANQPGRTVERPEFEGLEGSGVLSSLGGGPLADAIAGDASALDPVEGADPIVNATRSNLKTGVLAAKRIGEAGVDLTTPAGQKALQRQMNNSLAGLSEQEAADMIATGNVTQEQIDEAKNFDPQTEIDSASKFISDARSFAQAGGVTGRGTQINRLVEEFGISSEMAEQWLTSGASSTDVEKVLGY